jgi:hypothetical protein
VNDADTKAAALALATVYFNDVRPRLVDALATTFDAAALDQAWQELVRLAHGNNARGTYLKLAKRLAAELKEVSVQVLSRAAERQRPAAPFSTSRKEGRRFFRPPPRPIDRDFSTCVQTSGCRTEARHLSFVRPFAKP